MPHWGCVSQGAEFGVRVNSVAPGFVETPALTALPREHLDGILKTSHLIERLIQPEEVRVERLRQLRRQKAQHLSGLIAGQTSR